MSTTLALRRTILASLGLAPLLAACNGAGDDAPSDTDVDTDRVPLDTDTDAPPDTDDTAETDAPETDVETDPPVETDTDVERLCGPAADPEAELRTTGWLTSGRHYELCLPIPLDAPACAEVGVQQLQAAFDELLADACTDPDTGWPSCGGFSVDLVCGPETSTPEACCFVIEPWEWVVGRPFRVDGETRRAPVAASGGWAGDADVALPPEALRPAVAAAWADVARGEHASVASFAAFVLDLLALGAPADLLADASAAMADEVRHARDAFALASAVGGAPVGPGPLPVGGAVGRADAAAVLAALITEGCVGETIAAHEAGVARDLAADPALRARLAGVAEDEGRHAALAWRTARWLLAREPALLEVAERALREALDAVSAQPAGTGLDLSAWGVLGGRRRADAAARCVDEVVRPAWAALRASLGA